MNIYLFRDYIGLFAPVILLILTLFLLRNKKFYLTFFVSGFIFNNVLNILLKYFIKEPRPTDDQRAIEIAIVNGQRVGFDKFGMPSGHAQNCGFTLLFVTLVLKNHFITTLYLLISFISLFQRYLYKNHTFLQLTVGFIVGSLVGYLTYLLGKKHLEGNVKMKKDENAPI
jgi:membrane-associated phospholipid phosphatase